MNGPGPLVNFPGIAKISASVLDCSARYVDLVAYFNGLCIPKWCEIVQPVEPLLVLSHVIDSNVVLVDVVESPLGNLNGDFSQKLWNCYSVENSAQALQFY